MNLEILMYIVNGEELDLELLYFSDILSFGAYGTRTGRKVAIKKSKHIFAHNEDSKRLCREFHRHLGGAAHPQRSEAAAL